ncbi:MAG: stage III sporulation protein AA [Bacillota bacterium]|nr:stage III sporulation protein AA [Bacillota bacterium]
MDREKNRYPGEGISKGRYRFILESVPISIRSLLSNLSIDELDGIEEFRLKVDAPLMVYGSGFNAFVTEDGRLSKQKTRAYVVTEEDASKALQLMCNCSLYSIEDDLRSGFITIRGGHRIGVAGKVVTDGGRIKTIKDISSLNIRVSREVLGCAGSVIPYLIKDRTGVYNTLIISPPQCGKTTLLRDIIRQLSGGVPSLGFEGIKVGVVDERSEIAGCYKGVPQNDVGIRTDVLDACPKAQGVMMLIRSMSPVVIATDELGRPEDLTAVGEAVNAGVSILTTVHGWGRDDAARKPVIGELLRDGVFERIVVLSRKRGPGTIDEIYDGALGKKISVSGGGVG